MTAAKTVSRANPAFSAGAAIMTETISAVSMTVTARARTSVPNGSPTRCATTSAWYTAANTVPSRATPATAAISPPTPRKAVIDKNHPGQCRPGPCPPRRPRCNHADVRYPFHQSPGSSASTTISLSVSLTSRLGIRAKRIGAFSLVCRRRPASSSITATALALSSAPGVLGTIS